MSHSQKSNRKLWCIIPAAGSGRRFSKTELKQYQTINGTTVLEHTVHKLNSLPLSGYVLALNEQDSYAPSLAFTNKHLAHFCLGGAERVNSVLNGLAYLSNIADQNDWVLVHDAARPCVNAECLLDLVQKAETTQQSAILATPVRDTLKRVVSNQSIEKTIDRESLWQAQTPQIAPLGLLKSALEHALNAGITITDEASALEFNAQPVHVVMGRSDNIKITYPDDLKLATLILNSQLN